MKKIWAILFGGKDSHSSVEETVVSGDEKIVLSTDTGPAIRAAFWIVGVAFGSFLLWAYFAPLDEGAKYENILHDRDGKITGRAPADHD